MVISISLGAGALEAATGLRIVGFDGIIEAALDAAYRPVDEVGGSAGSHAASENCGLGH